MESPIVIFTSPSRENTKSAAVICFSGKALSHTQRTKDRYTEKTRLPGKSSTFSYPITYSSNSKNSAGSSSTKSVGNIARCEYALAHRSPANPWRYTPLTAAFQGSTPCAQKAAIIPAKTSPLPPLAMPGLPVGL